MPVKLTVPFPLISCGPEIDVCSCEPVTSATETASAEGDKKAIPIPVGFTTASPSADSSPILDCN